MQPSMLELALAYAAKGIPVFPARPANEEVVDPATGEVREYNVKSPYTVAGLREATTTERIIRRWWQDWPQAVPAIPTGRASGFWVLDLDKGENKDGIAMLAELEQENTPLPTTRTVETPSGGRHLLFSLPADREVRNRGKFKPGADTRGDGGYVLAPGSVLVDGRQYVCTNPEAPIADAPEWLLDMVVRKALPAPVDGVQPSSGYVQAVVEAEISALESTTQGRNQALNDAAFALGTLVGAGALDRGEAERRLLAAAQFNGYVAKDGAGQARSTIASGLTSGMRHPRQVPEEMSAEEGARLAANLIGMDSGQQVALVQLGRHLASKLVNVPVEPSMQPMVADGEPPAPPMHPDPFDPSAAGGLLRELALWITETAIIPVPELSLAASLGLLAGLFGDKALGPTGTGVNLYMTTILDTAGGKGHPPKAIRRVSDALGAMGVVSNGDHTSYAAFERTLRKSNTKSVTVVMDEFGITLQDVNNKYNRSASASIRKFLLAIYDQANSSFDGRTYASADAKGDEEPILGPALTVLGMTTAQTFFDGLTEASISDGFLNRFIFMTTSTERKDIKPPKLDFRVDIPEDVLRGLSHATGMLEELVATREATKAATNKWRVPFVGGEQGEAYQLWGDIFLWQHDPAWTGEKRDIRARAAENTLRLATLRAISSYASRPAISVGDIKWAWGVVWRSIMYVQEGVATHMVASQAEGLRRAVLEALSDAGSKGLPYSKLLSRRGVRGSETRQIEEALKWLVEADEIVDLKGKSRPGRGSVFALNNAN